MSEDLKLVFTGSGIEAGFVKEMLEEAGIGTMLRNSLRESLTAGWVSGAPEDSTRVFVETNNEKEALKLVDEYFRSR